MPLPNHPAYLLRMLRSRLKQLATSSPILAASFGSCTHRCGGLSCRCHHGGPLHAGQHLTFKEEGKTRSVSVPKALLPEVRSWLAEGKRLNRLRHEIHQLTVALLRAKARSLPFLRRPTHAASRPDLQGFWGTTRLDFADRRLAQRITWRGRVCLDRQYRIGPAASVRGDAVAWFGVLIRGLEAERPRPWWKNLLLPSGRRGTVSFGACLSPADAQIASAFIQLHLQGTRVAAAGPGLARKEHPSALEPAEVCRPRLIGENGESRLTERDKQGSREQVGRGPGIPATLSHP